MQNEEQQAITNRMMIIKWRRVRERQNESEKNKLNQGDREMRKAKGQRRRRLCFSEISQFPLADMQVCIYHMAQQVRLSVLRYLCLSGNFYICIYIRNTLFNQTHLRSILMCYYYLCLFQCICVGSGFAYTRTAKPEITYIVGCSQKSLRKMS